MRDDGVILYPLLMLVTAILGLGLLLTALGRGMNLRADSQAGADAAALAAARTLLHYRYRTDGSPAAGPDCTTAWRMPGAREAIVASAEELADRNGAALDADAPEGGFRVSGDGCFIQVHVVSKPRLGASARGLPEGSQDRRARAVARAEAYGGRRPELRGSAPILSISAEVRASLSGQRRLLAEAADRLADDRAAGEWIAGGGRCLRGPAPLSCPRGPYNSSEAVSRLLQAAGFSEGQVRAAADWEAAAAFTPVHSRSSGQFRTVGSSAAGRSYATRLYVHAGEEEVFVEFRHPAKGVVYWGTGVVAGGRLGGPGYLSDAAVAGRDLTVRAIGYHSSLSFRPPDLLGRAGAQAPVRSPAGTRLVPILDDGAA